MEGHTHGFSLQCPSGLSENDVPNFKVLNRLYSKIDVLTTGCMSTHVLGTSEPPKPLNICEDEIFYRVF